MSSNERAIALRPFRRGTHNNQGATLAEGSDVSKKHWRATNARSRWKPADYAEAYKNRGAALAALGRLEEALSSCDQAISLRPDYADAYANRAAALTNLGRIEEALQSCGTGRALNPDSVEARFNRGACQLALGDFEHGWEGFEWRWKSARGQRGLPGVHWQRFSNRRQNDSRACRARAWRFDTVLPLRRCSPDMQVILDVPVRCFIIIRLEGIDRVITGNDPLPPFDAWTPMMGLPFAFHTTRATIPASVPYLRADPDPSRRTAHASRRIARPEGGFGLGWLAVRSTPRPGDGPEKVDYIAALRAARVHPGY